MAEVSLDAFWRTPPITRTFATAVFVTSVGAHVFGVIPYSWLYFEEDRLFRLPPEIWRLVTNFFLSAPKWDILMAPYFVYQYLSVLETASPRFRRKEDVIWYLIVVGGLIILVNRVFLGGAFFLRGLILALCYTAVQDQRGAQASFYFFNVPAQTVPYCMLVMSLIMAPSMIPLELSGIFSAHLFDFLTRIWPEFGGGFNVLPTPSFLSRLVTTPAILQREYGTAINRGGNAGTSTGASTGSVLPDSWKTRGTGHRLGGD